MNPHFFTRQSLLAVEMAGVYITAQELMAIGEEIGVPLSIGSRELLMEDLLDHCEGIQRPKLREALERLIQRRDEEVSRLRDLYPSLQVWQTRWRAAHERARQRLRALEENG